jgi:hypothetical protein
MAKFIELTQDKQAIVDDEDYEHLNQWKWRAHYDRGNWYAYGNYKAIGCRTSSKMHRVILSAPIGIEVDHRNNNGLDNQKHNLRLATGSQNQGNRIKRLNASSKFKGVCFRSKPKKWEANIRVNYKRIYLLRYDDEIEAARAYDRAAKKHFGEFARLNFPNNEDKNEPN